MKKVFLTIGILLAAVLSWYGFTILTLPAPPPIKAMVGDQVDLKFSIHKMDITEIELESHEGGQPTFIHFTMEKAWAKGRPGLAVTQMKKQSKFGKKGMTPDKFKKEHPGNREFGQFMKDTRGKDVKEYTFRHQLAEGEDGRMYMEMVYTGPKVPFIQVLKFPGSIPVPQHLADRFGTGKKITFLKGEYYLDRKRNGFWIPVEVEG